MTRYDYNIGAGGTRTLILDGNKATLDGEAISNLDALEFMKNANAEGVTPQITKETKP